MFVPLSKGDPYLIDQVTGGGRFARIYMTNNNYVEMGKLSLLTITYGLGWHDYTTITEVKRLVYRRSVE